MSSALDQSRLDEIARRAMEAVARAVERDAPPLREHFFYGASAIHPRHLVTWYLFHTDADHRRAKESGLTARIDALTRQELAGRGYPAAGVPVMSVAFTTHETIVREAGGDYWRYFK